MNQTVEVCVNISRDLIVVFLLMDKLGLAKVILFLEIKMICKMILIVCLEASFLGSSKILARLLAIDKMGKLLLLAHIFKFIISKFLIWYL